MSDDMNSFVSTGSEQPKKKAKNFWALIVIPALIFALSDVLGERAADAIVSNSSERHEMSKIEQYIEQSKAYIPGILTSDKYSSQYWDLEFRAEGNWIMADEVDRESLSRETFSSAKNSAAAALEGQDINQELKDAFLDSIYAATEMYSLYVDENSYCLGDASIAVSQIYGLDEFNEAEYCQLLADSMKEQYGEVTVSEVTLAGRNRQVVTFSIKQNDMVLHVKVICMLDGVSACYLRITYVDGYEDVYTSFLNQISACN